MKRVLLPLALLSIAFGSQAAGVDATLNINGSFTASCSLGSTSFSIGNVDLSSYMRASGSYAHVRYPLVLDVACNSETLPWRVFNTTPAGVQLAIGATLTNKACISRPYVGNTNDSFGCATNGLTGVSAAEITGTGTQSVDVDLVIWNNYDGRKAYVGTGAISAAIPVRLEF